MMCGVQLTTGSTGSREASFLTFFECPTRARASLALDSLSRRWSQMKKKRIIIAASVPFVAFAVCVYLYNEHPLTLKLLYECEVGQAGSTAGDWGQQNRVHIA